MLENTNTMITAARAKFEPFANLAASRQHKLIRAIRFKAISEIKGGERDPAKVVDACLEHVQRTEHFGSIITIIGMAILVELVQWAVRRILDRWFEGGSDDG